MIKPGLVSVTFRQLRAEQIIELTSKAGLHAIEWGGDIHVPHGDAKRAKQVRKMTLDSGLEISSYGSYYRCGHTNSSKPGFEDVLKSAVSLKAGTIRVWAGELGSHKADEEYFLSVINDARQIAETASSEGIKIAFEYHSNTLTDSILSTDKLLKGINHPNIFSYWQPPSHYDKEDMKPSIKSILPFLSNIHVYHWVNGQRFPLRQGKEKWEGYFKEISKAEGDRYALLEFVKDDRPEQLIDDAGILNEIIEKYSII